MSFAELQQNVHRPCNMRLAEKGRPLHMWLAVWLQCGLVWRTVWRTVFGVAPTCICQTDTANRQVPCADTRVPPWTWDTPLREIPVLGMLINSSVVKGNGFCTPPFPYIVFATRETRGCCYIVFDMHCQCCSARHLKRVYLFCPPTIFAA